MSDFNILKELPEDILICHILPYLRPEIKVWTNKENYEKYHFIVKKMIAPRFFCSYVRDIIRNDFSFVFNMILRENFDKWLKMKNYKYNDIMYDDYVKYINDYCIKNESTKCKILLREKIKNANMSKNWHKNNRNKDIRWSN
jgi:hypothetical protein